MRLRAAVVQAAAKLQLAQVGVLVVVVALILKERPQLRTPQPIQLRSVLAGLGFQQQPATLAVTHGLTPMPPLWQRAVAAAASILLGRRVAKPLQELVQVKSTAVQVGQVTSTAVAVAVAGLVTRLKPVVLEPLAALELVVMVALLVLPTVALGVRVLTPVVALSVAPVVPWVVLVAVQSRLAQL